MRRLNSPLWLDGADTNYPAVNDAVDVDVAVVGAGITGTTAAYLLKRAGRRSLSSSQIASALVPLVTRQRSSRSATVSSTGN